jgi:hypothetical protein
LEFLYQASRPIIGMALILDLDRSYTYGEIGPYRILVEIADDNEVNHQKILMGSRTWLYHFEEEDKKFSLPCIEMFIKSVDPDSTLYESSKLYMDNMQADLAFFMRSKAALAFNNILDFDRKNIYVYISENLSHKVKSIKLLVNQYILGYVHQDNILLVQEDDYKFVHGNFRWPDSPEAIETILSEVDPMIMISQKGDVELQYPREMRVEYSLLNLWQINFNEYTPPRWNGMLYLGNE